MGHATVEIDLEEPLQAHGETITKLILKPPSGKDISNAGYPFSMERNARTGGVTETVHMPAVRNLLAIMAQVPPSTIDQLSAVSMMQGVEALRYFFYYKAPKKSSNSPSAGADGAAT